ncbi:MAG: VOC family protein [Alphaproteobacteria bacterium]|jgi:catechol-2,3-dioxygenase
MAFKIIALDHLVLRATKLETMLDFYRDVLGCTLERSLPESGLYQLRAGSSLIDLVDLNSELGREGGGAPDPNARNLDHFCLRIEPFEEGTLRAHLRSHNIEAGELKRRYGAEGTGPSLYLEDPEGNTIELKGPADEPV